MTVSLYTDGRYENSNPSWHVEDSLWKAERIKDLLDDTGLNPKTVCEVGCGAGEILVRLQEKMDCETRLWGYDVSPQAIALCRPRQNNRLEFIEGNPNTGGTPFDLLLAIDVIEHVEDCFAFLRGLAPLARHHVFHIPLEMHVSAVARMSPLLAARRGVGHIHYFSRETALALLADCGYEILAERYTAGALGLAQSGLATRVARLPRYVASQISTHFAARWLGGFSLLVLAKPRDSI